jgi:hypothetical protein
MIDAFDEMVMEMIEPLKKKPNTTGPIATRSVTHGQIKETGEPIRPGLLPAPEPETPGTG